jgi:hypothetical protein
MAEKAETGGPATAAAVFTAPAAADTPRPAPAVAAIASARRSRRPAPPVPPTPGGPNRAAPQIRPGRRRIRGPTPPPPRGHPPTKHEDEGRGRLRASRSAAPSSVPARRGGPPQTTAAAAPGRAASEKRPCCHHPSGARTSGAPLQWQQGGEVPGGGLTAAGVGVPPVSPPSGGDDAGEQEFGCTKTVLNLNKPTTQ